MTADATGSVLLVPNALDFGAHAPGELTAALPLAVIQRAARLTHWVVEDAKSARAFIGRVSQVAALAAPLQAHDIHELPRPPKGGAGGAAGRPRAGTAGARAGTDALTALLQPALQGHDLGLLSEAGMPAVADPGAGLVARAHELGLRVEPLPGSSALLLALAASGLNGQQFAFVGYLPVPDAERAERIRELEAWSQRSGQTQIAIETPYRNAALMRALLQNLRPATRLCVACAVGWPEGWCRTLRVSHWRNGPPTALGERLPAVFLFQAG